MDVEKRRLGRTGLQVSVIGFGAAVVRAIPRGDAEKVLVHALDRGVNYFDTAPGYGDSEEKLSTLSERRNEFYIATKIDPPFRRKDAEASIRRSLQRLKTSKIDLMQLHGIGDPATYKTATGSEGALAAIEEARKSGLIDYIGITSHNPEFLSQVIVEDKFDMVLVPFNALYRDAATQLFDEAEKLDIGVAIMKPFASGYLAKSTPETEHLFKGRNVVQLATNALRFILTHKIATIVPGTSSIKEVDVNVGAGEGFTPLTRREDAELSAFCEEVGRFICRAGIGTPCVGCLPCPEGINITRIFPRYQRAVLRNDPLQAYHSQFMDYYQSLSATVANCTECGECETRCPHGVPIIHTLKSAETLYKTSTIK
jgi:predicted aldo/keto reductase-like oxidoreductase